MRTFIVLMAMAVIIISCHPNSSNSGNATNPVPDVISENVKGPVKQVETDTYLVDSTTGKQGKMDGKGTEIFNDSGYSLSYNYYSPKDSSTMITTLEHNANNYLTGVKTVKNGKPFSSMNLTVDSTGHYSLVTSTDSTGKEDVYYDSIKINDYGQVLSAKGHHPDSTLKMTFVNSYDSVFYTGGESKDSVGKLTYSATVKLNDKKDPKEMEETNVTKDSTTKTTTTYTYDTPDSHGNWTQQTTYKNGKPDKIIKRIITYKE